MPAQTNIEWCDSTFNPWIGCTKVSPACDNCYAEALMSKRMHRAEWGSGKPRVRTSAANWKEPLKWNAKPFYECTFCGLRNDHPMNAQCIMRSDALRTSHVWKPARRRVFCASLADVFDNEVPWQWRLDLFSLIRDTPNIDWLLLTKRIGNVQPMLNEIQVHGPLDDVFPNVWLGATICNQDEADRDIPKLLSVPAAVRFLSIEPMLGSVDLTRLEMVKPAGLRPGVWLNALTGHVAGPDDVLDETVNWVIVGGESGPHARPMHPDWVRSLRDQCVAAGVPFLFKQWGEFAPNWLNDDTGNKIGGSEWIDRMGKRIAGRALDGVEWHQFPEAAFE